MRRASNPASDLRMRINDNEKRLWAAPGSYITLVFLTMAIWSICRNPLRPMVHISIKFVRDPRFLRSQCHCVSGTVVLRE